MAGSTRIVSSGVVLSTRWVSQIGALVATLTLVTILRESVACWAGWGSDARHTTTVVIGVDSIVGRTDGLLWVTVNARRTGICQIGSMMLRARWNDAFTTRIALVFDTISSCVQGAHWLDTELTFRT